jgi:hypothetical protein
VKFQVLGCEALMTKSNSSAIAFLFLLGIGAAGAFAVRASAVEPIIHVESGVAPQRAAADGENDSARRGAKSITGRIVDESGQPIPNAAVFLRKIGPPSGPTRSIGTDEDGRFHSDDLAAGSYMVLTNSPGYVPANEADREYYRPGDAVNIRMIKGGVITGTVTNSNGEPVVGVKITTIRVRDGESRAIQGAGQSGMSRQTDDRGVYRAYGLLPGTYLVVASGGGQMSYPSTAYDTEVPTYYPSTTRDAAGEVVVRAGQEAGGIDIRYRGDRGFIVSGTLSGALGDDSLGMRGVVVSLTHRSSGAVESRAFVQLRTGKSFAVYGVPDGDYDLVAQMDVGRENSAASSPRHVVVKGTDVTGIDLSLAPLGSIAGRAVLEKIPAAERASDCKVTRITTLEELVIISRRDEKTAAKSLPGAGIAALIDGSPDEKGAFKISSLAAGRHRIELRLPTDDWFVKAMSSGGSAAKQSDAAAWIVISPSQRVTDLTVTLGEGAASLRGKVVAASEGARLPALQVHLVPAETEAVDNVIRFAEVRVDSEGGFSVSNIAPGRYYLVARAVPDDQIMERNPQPLSLDAASRAKLRREAQAANVVVELQRCQRIVGYELKYTASVKPETKR